MSCHDRRVLGLRCPGVLAAAVLLAWLALAGSAAAEPSGGPLEILPGTFQVAPSTDAAGAHENLVTSFNLAHEVSGGENAGKTHDDLKTVIVNLPPGFVGNNTAVPTCTDAQLLSHYPNTYLPNCPIGSQIGTIAFELSNPFGRHEAGAPLRAQFTVPLYNMAVTSFGVTAEFGFQTIDFSQTLQVRVRPDDSGLTITTPNIPKFEIDNVSVTVWGVPAAQEHDAQRGETCGLDGTVPPVCEQEFGGPKEANIPVKPFLANATSCEPHAATIEADSWEEPENWSKAGTELGSLGECERVPFDPSIEVQPTTDSAESSSGLNVSLVVPQAWEEPYSLSTANLEDTVLTLPEGYTVNPSAGSGLGACSPEQYESETSSSAPGAGCPPEAKIGTVEVETPVLAEKLTGNIYIAKPYDNPFDSLLGLYIVVKDPARGIIVKLAGRIEANAMTGQLVTTFDDNPQVPFSKFTLKLRQGATSPLVSPPACGTYTAQADFTPWSQPLSSRLLEGSLEIEHGIGGGPCPAGGVPPFAPQVISGTDNNAAGTYSPFYLRIIRQDGEQELTHFSTTLPPGLTGNLSGIPFCPEADIEAARGASGTEELEHPSCPAASEVGHTIVSAGVGSVLAQTPGRLYLAGPYHGAPLSLVSVTSAKVGPFDLGTVVIRFALDINPTTAQVEVSASGSEPIPHIIDGIVVHVREIRVYVDREKFILNPTNCDPLSIQDTIVGAGANFQNPADADPVPVLTRFQAADCSSLKFEPNLTVTTSAKTSRADGASLTAKLTIPAALGTQANISRVKVELPEQLPSRLTTLQKACTAAQFDTNPAGCPSASIIGHAKAITPILTVPLEGPAYFVSHGGEAFPDLEIVLQGYGVTIDLTASTFISKAGITSSTFKAVPDQPVTTFELTLPEGPYSALTALGNLCTATKTVTVKKKVTVRVHGRRKTITRKVKQAEPATLEMPTEFVAQNGAEIHQSTPIAVTGCSKAVRHERKKNHRKKRRK